MQQQRLKPKFTAEDEVLDRQIGSCRKEIFDVLNAF